MGEILRSPPADLRHHPGPDLTCLEGSDSVWAAEGDLQPNSQRPLVMVVTHRVAEVVEAVHQIHLNRQRRQRSGWPRAAEEDLRVKTVRMTLLLMVMVKTMVNPRVLQMHGSFGE